MGINLLPVEKKICNFNCIYCECGWTFDSDDTGRKLPTRKEVYEALEIKLSEMKAEKTEPDVITYAGNGEPTLHPEFSRIIDDTIELRNKYFPHTSIAVLSNSTTIRNPEIKAALLKIDRNILKLDSALDNTIKIHNAPKGQLNAPELISELASFNGKLIIQTLFLRGRHNGHDIDNTSPEEIKAWLDALSKIKPSEVMIYTISRDTPEGNDLKKVPEKELMEIAGLVNKLGIKTQVSA